MLSPEWCATDIAADVDVTKPGIYRWTIEGGWIYIGKYTNHRRPTKHYRRNVERLLNGLPSHHPDGAFRRVYHALADAVRDGRCITLTILANAEKSALNRLEQQFIRSEGANLNGPASRRPDANSAGRLHTSQLRLPCPHLGADEGEPGRTPTEQPPGRPGKAGRKVERLPERLSRQLSFLLAADGLKAIDRHNRVFSGTRHENAAEHSWHLTLMALTLGEDAPAGTDLSHVIELLIAHDLVEVHAGDHWAALSDPQDVAAKEAAAAETLFGLLPIEQARRLAALWREFESRRTKEARFAKALDALHPMMMVWGPGGTDYTHTPLTATAMRAMKQSALETFPRLWTLARHLLDAAVARGTLAP